LHQESEVRGKSEKYRGLAVHFWSAALCRRFFSFGDQQKKQNKAAEKRRTPKKTNKAAEKRRTPKKTNKAAEKRRTPKKAKPRRFAG